MTESRGRSPFVQKFVRSAVGSSPNPIRGFRSPTGDNDIISSSRKSSSFVAKLRSRSGSRRRASNKRGPSQHHDDELVPMDSSGKATAAQIEDLIEQHQLALKMDMMDMLENHEKELKFWKTKALKSKKTKSAQEPEQDSCHPSLQPSSSIEDEKKESVQELLEKVSRLEREVENRNILIVSLNKTMDTLDKANEERVQLLENQLERLVEMKTPVTPSNSSQLLEEFSIRSIRSERSTRSNMDRSIHADEGDRNNEVSVLEQLLARVLAEKDKLLFENQNLRAILRESEANPSDGNTNSSKKGQDDSKCNTHTSVDHESKPAEEEYEYYKVRYQMSCKLCENNHSHVKYKGACTGNAFDTQQALKKTMGQHFCQIWS